MAKFLTAFGLVMLMLLQGLDDKAGSVPATEADQVVVMDVFDSLAHNACAITFPNGGGSHVEHAHPTYMDSNHIRYWCDAESLSGLQECTWTAIVWLPLGGPITGHGAMCELPD